MDLLGMDRSFTSRSVNEGFSGGEKKRNEILQLAMLEPKYAVLDETDSGLDIDALKIVAHGVNTLRGPNLGHSSNYPLSAASELHRAGSRPCHGRRAASFGAGGKELALELEERATIGHAKRAANQRLDQQRKIRQ